MEENTKLTGIEVARRINKFDNAVIWIPGNVPSLKNSKVKTSKGIFSSPSVNKYIRTLGIQSYSASKKVIKEYKDPKNPNIFRNIMDIYFPKKTDIINPLVLGFHFVRNSKHKFDFNNANQLICDLLVAHDYIEDDNMDYLIPMPFKIGNDWYSYNKENPGVYLKVLEFKY
jgi:hypothetical protein